MLIGWRPTIFSCRTATPTISPIVYDIATRTGAQVIATPDVGEWLMKQGITNVHQDEYRGKCRNFGDFTVKCVVAQHSSGLPDGSYGGNPMGFSLYR